MNQRATKSWHPAVFGFEEIGRELPWMPLAARRALDVAGRKLSLQAWQKLPRNVRLEVVQLGVSDDVDAARVRAAIFTADPPAARLEPDDEQRLEQPSAQLLQLQPIPNDQWLDLSKLQRFALLHLAARDKRALLQRAWREMTPARLTHLSASGEAHMVDVGEKPVTHRCATASAKVRMAAATAQMVVDHSGPKGDVLATARLAGIMAAKRTPELIPLCHAIALTRVELRFEVDVSDGCVEAVATVDARDRTGVEMEAMVAASVAALTIYDMLKAVERSIRIEQVVLLEKSGGRSGHYRHNTSSGSPPSSQKP